MLFMSSGRRLGSSADGSGPAPDARLAGIWVAVDGPGAARGVRFPWNPLLGLAAGMTTDGLAFSPRKISP